MQAYTVIAIDQLARHYVLKRAHPSYLNSHIQ